MSELLFCKNAQEYPNSSSEDVDVQRRKNHECNNFVWWKLSLRSLQLSNRSQKQKEIFSFRVMRPTLKHLEYVFDLQFCDEIGLHVKIFSGSMWSLPTKAL